MDIGESPLEDQLSQLWTGELDPLFWPASRAGIESAWVVHIPFAHWIVTVHRPRFIVELGTHNGVSYSAFCEAVQRAKLDCRCVAVDTWQGDEHAGFYGEEVYADLRRFHATRYTSFSELMRCTFDTALAYVPDNSVDLLHIDGLHTYDAVRHDFEGWRPKLTERAVVLFHDTNVRARDFGVWRFWAELSRQYPSFEFLHGHGLGVLAIGTSSSEAVRALTQLSNSSASVVRERFSFLGERWQGEMRAGLTWAEHAIRADTLEAELARISTNAAARLKAETARAADLEARLKAETARAVDLEAGAAEREARQRGRAEAAEADLERGAADLAMARTELTRAQAAMVATDSELKAVRHQAWIVRSELQAVMDSTSWRATVALRRSGRLLPVPLRRLARKGLRVLWWSATFQLVDSLRARRRELARARLVATSPPL